MAKDIRPALFAFLLADGGISAIVEAVRIYPIKIPQGIKKASVVYTRVSGQGDYHMEGASGYSRPRFQIDAWAPTAAEATTLANKVRDRIDGYSGVMGSGAAVVNVQGVFIADEREDYDDTVQLYRMGRDYFIHFEEL